MKLVTKTLSCFLILSCFISCQKSVEKQAAQEEVASAARLNKDQGHLQQTKTFSADVVIRWLNMQLDMLRVPLFVNKYTYNLVRPITYIRNVMGYSSWNALFNTPGHPEFPSAHAVNGTAIATMLTDVVGDKFQFTLHTYDYLGLRVRSYNSFLEMSKEMSDSRVFGGIHYQASCDKGQWLGKKVSQNILSKVKFLKELKTDNPLP